VSLLVTQHLCAVPEEEEEEEERETKQFAGKGKIVCGAEQVG
jgi:hypothetical protein